MGLTTTHLQDPHAPGARPPRILEAEPASSIPGPKLGMIVISRSGCDFTKAAATD